MKPFIILLFLTGFYQHGDCQVGIMVFQTDFGMKDGAVAAMKGVAMGVSPALKLFDLTHEIPAFNIWEAAYRLEQTASYWPKGTVFVSVVDPGVGSNRKPVVMKSRSGHFFVTPDNGTLTLIATSLGVDELRLIDETKNRLPGSGGSYTFHGRDVFAYTGARLASGKINLQDIGPVLKTAPMELKYQVPEVTHSSVKGFIPVLDIQYGNIWTNIPETLLNKINLHYGDSMLVVISRKGTVSLSATLPFVPTFGSVPEMHELAYLNSLMNLSFSVNQGSFAGKHHIESGLEWEVEVSKLNDDGAP
jgi:S-adenosylmethionine hydrolase